MTRILWLTTVLVAGCAQTATWQAASPPARCAGCYQVQISPDWELVYQPASLSDERGGNPWQKPEALQREDSPATRRQQVIRDPGCLLCSLEPGPEQRPGAGIQQR